jgi:hypothetical protein
MKLADDSCDGCGRECRNCPPSEGDSSQEFVLEQMASSARGLKLRRDDKIIEDIMDHLVPVEKHKLYVAMV